MTAWRNLCVVMTCSFIASGCSTMRGPSRSGDAKATGVPAGQAGWLAGARRQLDLVARDIQADLDFHDTEGLDAFAPDAAAQVNAIRADMNSPVGINR